MIINKFNSILQTVISNNNNLCKKYIFKNIKFIKIIVSKVFLRNFFWTMFFRFFWKTFETCFLWKIWKNKKKVMVRIFYRKRENESITIRKLIMPRFFVFLQKFEFFIVKYLKIFLCNYIIVTWVVTKSLTENPNNFSCDVCIYITCNKKDFSKHLDTIKHKKGQIVTK